jgi:hypothetical protein
MIMMMIMVMMGYKYKRETLRGISRSVEGKERVVRGEENQRMLILSLYICR